jgi:type II secretory pathway pseudopilin PulG
MSLRQKTTSVSPRASFTLIELLIVIGIVAVLSVVVIVILNPAQLLAQSRDSTRLNDLASLNTALALFQTDNAGASLGTANTVYVSLADSSSTCGNLRLPALPSGWNYNCVSTTTLRNTDGTGWIPLNFNSISARSPLSSLPIDPTNASSSRLYYTYTAGSGVYEVSAVMESTKYKLGGADVVSQDGGQYVDVYEKGTSLSLLPVDYGDSLLAGFWKFDDGSGSTAYDGSGSGHTGTLQNSPTWSTGSSCKIGGCLSFDGSSNRVDTNFSPNISNGLSLSVWVNLNLISGAHAIFGSPSGTNISEVRWNSNVLDSVWNGFTDGLGAYRNAPVSLSTSTWSLVTVTFNGSSNLISVYQDGTLKGTRTITSPQASWNNGGNLIIARRDPGTPEYWSGLLDEIRVYNRVLSAAEVQAVYNATK